MNRWALPKGQNIRIVPVGYQIDHGYELTASTRKSGAKNSPSPAGSIQDMGVLSLTLGQEGISEALSVRYSSYSGVQCSQGRKGMDCTVG